MSVRTIFVRRVNIKESSSIRAFQSYLERQLEILSAPDVEARVVCSQTLEECLVNGEEASRHGGASHGLRAVIVSLLLTLGNAVPVELQGRKLVNVNDFRRLQDIRTKKMCPSPKTVLANAKRSKNTKRGTKHYSSTAKAQESL